MPRKGKKLEPKEKTSVSLSQEARLLLDRMAEVMQVSKSAVLETAIREKARRDRVTMQRDGEE